MSVTNAHAIPASFQEDYAIINALNNHTGVVIDDDFEENDLDSDEQPRPRVMGIQPPQHVSYHVSTSPTRRKLSFGGPKHRRLSESTPLLGDIPRIAEEEVDEQHDDETQSWKLWLQEANIIRGYTLPVFGTHLLEYSLSMASVISIGHISTTHLAAITLGSMTSSVTGLSILLGFVSALDTLLPQAWTSSNPRLVGLWSQRMGVLMAMLLVPIFLIWFNAEALLLGLKQEPEVAHLAAVYLRWLSIGLPAYAFNAVTRRFFQSQGLLHVPTAIVIIVAPINILLNYVLVWGPPALRLGYIGAPIATGISFNLIAICSIIYGIFLAPRDAWHPVGPDSFKNLGILVQLGSAGVGQLASEWWSWELIGLAASLLGPVALASQSVLLVSASTSYQAPYALSVAASVRIGNLLGSQNAIRAKAATIASMLLALALGCFFSLVFFLGRHKWAYIFNNDPEVVALVGSVLPLVGIFQIVDGVCAVTAGVLRSRGRQAVGALIQFTAYYIIGIPLGLLLTFKFSLALYGLWAGLAVALLYGAIVTSWIVLRTDWELEIRKVQNRLARDHKSPGGRNEPGTAADV